MEKLRVIVLTGPTAVGKSEIAILIGRTLHTEIVSADSMQVYKSLDIGTAKPSLEEREKVAHHLIDIIEPNTEFSVAEYQRSARQAIEDISDRGKLPILVGGSGLYLRAAIDKFEFPQGRLNSEIRQDLEEELRNVGYQALYEKLKELDSRAAAKIEPRNTRRVIRALEVIKATGQPFSDFQREWSKRESIYNAQIFALSLPRSELYARIDARVDRMINNGLIEETSNLLSKGYGETITATQALGYRQALDYLENKISLEDCINLIKQNTRRFAKRQITWLTRDPRVVWIDISSKPAEKVAQDIIYDLRAKQFIN